MKKVVRMENWKLQIKNGGEVGPVMVLWGYAFGHPRLGDSRVMTSMVRRIYKTAKGKLRAETWNTIYELHGASTQFAIIGWADPKTPAQEVLS